MPLAQLYIGKGRSYDQKKLLIEKITQAIVDSLGSQKENVWVVLNEVPRSEWGIGGVPLGKPGE
jgi:4-oxalocrotonate tautomerase